jgi:hypothetical protein
MINPLRQFLSVALVLSLLSANGLYFAPLLNVIKQSGEESASMQKCCCCTSGGEMTAKCCCVPRHSGANDRSTCSVAAAPCAAPLAVLSPNVLDQWIDPGFSVSKIVVNAAFEKFPSVRELLLSGTENSLFHPPQSSFS